MKKITYSLNYRKPKKSYKQDDELTVCLRSYQKLHNGNVLVTTVGGGGRSLEINSDGEIVWQAEYNLSLPNGAVYRANRIPGLYPISYSILINNYQEYDGQERRQDRGHERRRKSASMDSWPHRETSVRSLPFPSIPR